MLAQKKRLDEGNRVVIKIILKKENYKDSEHSLIYIFITYRYR